MEACNLEATVGPKVDVMAGMADSPDVEVRMRVLKLLRKRPLEGARRQNSEKKNNVWEIDADVFVINVGHGIGDATKAVVSLVSGGKAGGGTLV
jgi:hypothetical protein